MAGFLRRFSSSTPQFSRSGHFGDLDEEQQREEFAACCLADEQDEENFARYLRCFKPHPSNIWISLYFILGEFRKIFDSKKEEVILSSVSAELLQNDSPEVREELYERTLLRFLRARSFNIEQSEKLLQESLDWRKKVKITEVSSDMVQGEYDTGKAYWWTEDKDGLPFVIIRAAKHVKGAVPVSETMQFAVYMFEKGLPTLPMAQETFGVVFDLEGFSVWDCDYDISKQLVDTLQNQYPERLGKVYMVRAPMIFNAAWKIIRPWLNAVTASKIEFVSRPEDRFPQLFYKEVLPVRWGGELPVEMEWTAAPIDSTVGKLLSPSSVQKE